MKRCTLAVLLLSLGSLSAAGQTPEPAAATPLAAETPTPAAAPAEPTSSELSRRLDIVAAEFEKLRLGDIIPKAEGSAYGLGPAASKVYRTEHGVSIGGYGELLYKNFFDPTKVDAFDFQRAVLYVGYKFSDKFVLNTEIEIEHAKEIWLEFAYVDYLFRPELNFRAGLLLLPMGHINELHEPTVFLGALRPEVEQRILPTTWRENGVGVFGDLGPFAYRAYLVNGLKASGFTAQGFRGGRQKGAEGIAEDFAGVARVDFTGVPGLLVGVSGYYGGAGQQLAAEVSTLIVEGHLDFKWRGLEVRGLYARAAVQNVAALNGELKFVDAQSVGEAMQGFYAQVGFDVLSLIPGTELSATPFVRWEDLNTQLAVPEGFAGSRANNNQILTIGASFQPVAALVLKAEYQRRFVVSAAPADQFNALVGYIF